MLLAACFLLYTHPYPLPSHNKCILKTHKYEGITNWLYAVQISRYLIMVEISVRQCLSSYIALRICKCMQHSEIQSPTIDSSGRDLCNSLGTRQECLVPRLLHTREHQQTHYMSGPQPIPHHLPPLKSLKYTNPWTLTHNHNYICKYKAYNI